MEGGGFCLPSDVSPLPRFDIGVRFYSSDIGGESREGKGVFAREVAGGERKGYLQLVVEELVHAGQLGGHAEVDGPVANLDDNTATDVGVDLRVGELEACALGVDQK